MITRNEIVNTSTLFTKSKSPQSCLSVGIFVYSFIGVQYYCTNALWHGTATRPLQKIHIISCVSNGQIQNSPAKTGEFTVNLQNKINSEFRIPNSELSQLPPK